MSVVAVPKEQHQPQTPHGHFGLLGELVGDQTGRGHSSEDESNLAVFLAVARDVNVRELGLGFQVIKADFFSGDLRIEPHGLVDVPRNVFTAWACRRSSSLIQPRRSVRFLFHASCAACNCLIASSCRFRSSSAQELLSMINRHFDPENARAFTMAPPTSIAIDAITA